MGKLNSMTRKEFSDILIKCREEVQCGKNEICRRTGLSFHQIQRLENASNNFSIDNALLYLKEIGYAIYTQKGSKSLEFKDRKTFAQHFTSYWKDSNMTLQQLAEQSGVTKNVIDGIKYNTKNTSIDSLLCVLEQLGVNIEIKKQ